MSQVCSLVTTNESMTGVGVYRVKDCFRYAGGLLLCHLFNCPKKCSLRSRWHSSQVRSPSMFFWLPLEVVDETTTDDDGDRLLLVMLESRRPKQQQSVYIIHVVNFYTVMICLVKPEMTAASLCFICMTCLHDCFGRVIARCCLLSLSPLCFKCSFCSSCRWLVFHLS